MPTFNILTDPWLPVQTRDRGLQEMGLLHVLEQAHNLDSLVDPAPPIQLGLYRFLIAFLMDALVLRELEDLTAILEQGRFDLAEITRYVDREGTQRFDLFDDLHPFLQSRGKDPKEPKSVAQLFFHLPSGNNVMHFHHMREDQHAIAPAVCARALCAIAPFMIEGGPGFSPSINGTPPWYVLIRRESLFQTLLLNTYLATDIGLRQGGVAPWRSNQPVVPKQELPCRTLMEGLTWRPRYVRLLPGEGGTCTYSGRPSSILVRKVFFDRGFKFVGTNWTDPQVAYRTTDKGRLSLRPQEDRQLWRDTGPLLLLREGDYTGKKGRVRFSRPAVIDQLRQFQAPGFRDGPGWEVFEVYGVRADQAKIFEWQYDRLALPQGVGENPLAGSQVQQAIETADQVASCLREAVKQAYPNHRKGDRKKKGDGNTIALDRLIRRAQSRYWSMLERWFSEEFLEALANQDFNDSAAIAALTSEWNEKLRKEGWDSLVEVVDPLDADAEALERQQKALDYYRRGVGKLLDRSEPGKKSKARRKGR